MTVNNLGFVALYQDDYRGSASFFREALGLNRTLGYKKGITTSITGLAGVALKERQPNRAGRLLGAVDVMLEAVSGHFDPPDQVDYDRFLTTARAALGDAAFAVERAEGRALTLEQAVEYALASGGSRETVGQQQHQAGSRPDHPARLSDREVEVLRLVVVGLSNREIAQRLALSEKTVANHLTTIFNKTGTDNRTAATTFAIRKGLA